MQLFHSNKVRVRENSFGNTKNFLSIVKMPLVEVHISIPVPEPNPLLKSISEALSSALGKPEEVKTISIFFTRSLIYLFFFFFQYVFVHLVPSAFLLFAGKDEPCAMIQVSSIGAINAKTTNAFA